TTEAAQQPEASQQAEAVQPAEAGKPSDSSSATGAAANAANARVTFQFERAGVMVPQFLLAIDEAGNVSYAAEEMLPQQEGTPTPPTRHVEQKVVVTRETTSRIFALARASDRFNLTCASMAKKVADLGRKTLRYSGPDGEGSCTFNFSENKNVMELTKLVQGIVRTLDAGRRLEFDHRFDRLGLDQETAALVEDVDAGRALEVGTIGRTLRSIAADPEVLERVRGRAASLLQRFPPAG
ncbi:MAG TPA: hypothetical protein VGG96_00855, partial [Steroidobacteraceae bacterium]